MEEIVVIIMVRYNIIIIDMFYICIGANFIGLNGYINIYQISKNKIMS